MASERILFFGLIVALLMFLSWLIWLKYQDKWRQRASPHKVRVRRRDEEGLSPVVAAILMFVITVVLAAFLYLFIVYFYPPGPDALWVR